ncbi:hypothetical protein [Nocardiopsis salina]|uniref:hypothetical protein n=1 Tax=Nocardiopsis salina TaxID=245836 RepID=UPI001268DD4B|nr:hypothetical protein [Nocardiopsis salina]
MQATVKLPLLGAFSALALLVAATAAEAADLLSHTECSNGECHVEAATPEQLRSSEQAPEPLQGPSPEGGQGNTGPGSGNGGDAEGGTSASCVYDDAEFRSSGQEGPLPASPGSASCDSAAPDRGQGTQQEAEEAFQPEALAEQARAAMSPPAPEIGAAPPVDRPRFVHMPAWMWIDDASWEPVTATASVSAGSVTVTASPDQVVWDTGDGNEVVCKGPGTVYSPQQDEDEVSPDCGHTYTALPSAGVEGETDLTATWEWQVSWSTTDGEGGDLESLTTTSSVPISVSEIHSVITRIR